MKSKISKYDEWKRISNRTLSDYKKGHESEFDISTAFILKESILKAKAQGLIAGHSVTLYNQKRLKKW